MGRRVVFRAGATLAVLAALTPFLPRGSAPQPDRRPNIIIILSDDQTLDSLPHDPPVMPYLQGAVQDPSEYWTTFTNAFLSTPLCCPSRATILTGEYSHHTGVRTNYDGANLDESSTIATWLHDSGYRTGLIGKYLNGYPFGHSPYVPVGWDRWLAKVQGKQGSLYYDYVFSDQGFAVAHGHAPQDYSTDVETAAAVDFIRTTPADQPFFLEVTPSAPHRPWTPAPQDVGAYAQMPIFEPPSFGETDVSDKPAWVRELPPYTTEQRLALLEIRRRAFEAVRGVDRMVAGVIQALRDKGALDDTVVFFLTDNGLSLGEHRWVGKTCPYEECIRTPFAVRDPWVPAGTRTNLVSNVDLAPTIADLAGVRPGNPVDGVSLLTLLDPTRQGVTPWRASVFLEYVGDAHVPGWTAIRTADFLYVEYATGERELYDLTGSIGPADPYELTNQAANPDYAQMARELASRLALLRAG
jgi:N-acetylglucosamine-6-sulfatase